MTEGENSARELFDAFFKHTGDFVGKALRSNENLMARLREYYTQAWVAPKKFKGNSSGMGFVPEYLIFETIKQYLEKMHEILFHPVPRTYTGNQEETFYFLDKPGEPRRLLVQGLRVNDDQNHFHPTKYQHDITYQVKDGEWKVKAIVEVKGFVDFPSLRDDLKRLQDAESENKESLFAFVGFNMPGMPPESFADYLEVFTEKKNHFIILPGEPPPGIKISSLEDLLDNLA